MGWKNLPVRFKLDPAIATKKTAKEKEATQPQILAVKSFSMSPNPAKSEVLISFEIEEASGLEIMITDASGKVIANPSTAFTSGRNELSIDISKAAPGLLFVSLQNGEKIFTKQLVKEGE